MPWRDGAASLAQLGVERRRVTGPGRHVISVALERPPGWRIEGHPTLELVVDTPPTIVPDRSSVQVEVEGADLGSRPIQGGSGPHTYSFDIPAGLIDRRLDGSPVRGLDLEVAVQLEPAGERCQPADPAGAWAALLPASTLRLPHGDAGTREVGRFPYPVASDTTGAAVVLPRSPSTDAVAAGLQLCAAIGRWSEPGAPPPLLVTSDRLAAVDKDRRGLVLVGDADAEVLGPSVDLGRPPVAPPAGRATALVGVVASPLDHDRSVFVVHGDGLGLVLAARTLSSRRQVDALRGSRVSLVDDAPSVTLGGPEAVPSPPPELAPALKGGSHVSPRSWAFPALVLLAGFLAALSLVVWYRWGPGRRRRTP